jgi:hypothetical protein
MSQNQASRRAGDQSDGKTSLFEVPLSKPILSRVIHDHGAAPDFGFFSLGYGNCFHHVLGGRQQ